MLEASEGGSDLIASVEGSHRVSYPGHASIPLRFAVSGYIFVQLSHALLTVSLLLPPFYCKAPA